MRIEKQPTQSSQIDSFLPRYISATYRTFVEFMTVSDESEERFGFSRDILQNLLKYRDFDIFKRGVIESSTLIEKIDSIDEELTISSGYGFPEENGVILINEEVILYRKKEGNKLTGLLRGASGTTFLPTFKSKGEYVYTEPRNHEKGDTVKNLSVMFLVSMLESIHASFMPGISKDNVREDVNRSSILQNIKDFYQAKGTKLGIRSLFKMIFGENDVDVYYPGDQMIKPSVSTWSEDLIVRTVPLPEEVAQVEIFERAVNPDKLIGQIIRLKSYNDEGEEFLSLIHI